MPQSMAATRRHESPGSAGRRRHGRSRTSPMAVEGPVAERVHPGAGGQGVGDQRVQTLHPVRHPAGADAGDLGHVAEPARGRPDRPGARAAYAAARPASRASRAAIAPSPLRLQRRAGRVRPRAGQVVGRGERGAVGQQRLGGHHRGLSAAAAVRDADHPARRAAELSRDGRSSAAVIGSITDSILSVVGYARGYDLVG